MKKNADDLEEMNHKYFYIEKREQARVRTARILVLNAKKHKKELQAKIEAKEAAVYARDGRYDDEAARFTKSLAKQLVASEKKSQERWEAIGVLKERASQARMS